ncbi:oligopeptide transporter, OPT family [Shuttleworthella sp. MSX8B]|uniref:OPT family oligopeptide transporter n=1 Tax=Shuttleworthella sp. MSX8B TaxID=936574 RepID=UPI0004535CEA|nr:oligopeptide transporter, OPT family [Shuttleworthia sp. MSX8B]EUB12828.1 oligopeptide transporter, OPT family [Shuttleworthia sp. MSX8B]
MSEPKPAFKPFVSADENPPELTVTSIVIGILMAILFGAANAYLGLRVGMTVSASIPAAVISMGVIRFILRKDSILENNMVQTIGSAGESVAAGAIFTLPAIFLWAKEGVTTAPSLLTIAVIAAIGGSLGVFFMIPLREALIVKEHGTLPYPEGSACADVLEAGETGGAKAVTVFSGLGIAAIYKLIADGFVLFPSEVSWEIKGYKGAGFGADVLPALLGVGYICGPKVSSYITAGGMLAWFVIMPLIALFGASVASPIFPATKIVSEMGPDAIWSNYVKYIGAGAVAAGGIMSLIKSLPLIVKTFRDAVKGIGVKAGEINRQNKDISMKVVIGSIVVLAILMVVIPAIPLNPIGAIIVIIFGFFFATVSSRMVGLIGSSNNPVSGMTIATLLLATSVLKATGNIGTQGMIAAIAIGSIICISTAIAGDTSQDLKTGYIVGATPYRQQIGELIGVFASAVAVGGVLYLLNSAWGYGGKELPAPQATLMKLVVEGVMNGNLPWALVFTGVFIAIIVEILGIPVLAFAVGLYLPIYLSIPMMVGGLVRLYFDKKKMDEAERKDKVENGLLYSSGLIAGEGIIGILLAFLAVFNVKLDISKTFSLGRIGGVVFFALLTVTLVLFVNRKPKSAIK